MSGPISTAVLFLVNVIFGIYILVVVLRLLMQKVGASYHNPISQLVIKATQPIVKPLQRVVPGYKGIDFAIVFFLFVLELAKVAILLAITQGTFPDVGGWVIWAFADGCNDILDVYFYLIIIGAILSWITSMHHHPITHVVASITDPFLGVFRRFIPAMGGMDFTPLVAIVVIKLVQILVFGPLAGVGVQMALA
ncbi:MAG: YggT family protein [Coxiellaceae bacterium]|nr:YggT family protein [Coxiellaceae bacterium]